MKCLEKINCYNMTDGEGVEVFISAYAEVSKDFLHRFPSGECVQQYLKTVSEKAGAELICQCGENRHDSNDKTFTIKGPWVSVHRTRYFLQKFMSALARTKISHCNVNTSSTVATNSDCIEERSNVIQDTTHPIKNGNTLNCKNSGSEHFKGNLELEIPKPIVMYDGLDEDDFTDYSYRETSLEKIGSALKSALKLNSTSNNHKVDIETKDHQFPAAAIRNETLGEIDTIKSNIFIDKSDVGDGDNKDVKLLGPNDNITSCHEEIPTSGKNNIKMQTRSHWKYVINKQKNESKPRRRKVNNAIEEIKPKNHDNNLSKSVKRSKKWKVIKEKGSHPMLNKDDNYGESSEINVTHKKLKKLKKKTDSTDEDDSLEYACPECPYLAKKKSGLREHKRRAHRTKEFVCNICNKIFGYGKDLNRHKKSHEKPQNCCDICGKLYKGVRSLADHRRTHDDGYEKPEFQCDLCDKSFSTKYVLAYHIKSDHLGMKTTYLCPTCGKSFSKKHSYLQHANVHLGIRPYKCDLCEKTFTYEKSLKEHKFMHDNVRRFKCDLCDKSFRQSSALAIHARIHKEKKDYVCASCGREFSQKQALKRHERIHLGEKPFSCNLCGRNFTDASVLRRHMILIHKKEPKKWREDTISHVRRSQYFIDVLQKDIIVGGVPEIRIEKYRNDHMNNFEQLENVNEENLCRDKDKMTETEDVSGDRHSCQADGQLLLEPSVSKISSDMIMPPRLTNHSASLYTSTGHQDYTQHFLHSATLQTIEDLQPHL